MAAHSLSPTSRIRQADRASEDLGPDADLIDPDLVPVEFDDEAMWEALGVASWEDEEPEAWTYEARGDRPRGHAVSKGGVRAGLSGVRRARVRTIARGGG
jgi:hypothetical protein